MLTTLRFRSREIVFAAFAAALLAMTMAWHIPMMLWDHLDLVDMYQASRDGSLLGSIFWDLHGGHMHAAAYAVLLVTTTLSQGQPWLDCLVSWVLLTAYAAICVRLAWTSFARRGESSRWLICIAFLALYPGHLANLQWGWQVAVFLCLFGAAIVIANLGAPRLGWWHNTLALVGASMAYFSFATGIALLPVALLILSLRRDQSILRRTCLALPWLLAGAAVLYWHIRLSASSQANLDVMQLARYALNYVGGGITQFAGDLAPWFTVVALLTGARAFFLVRTRREALYWLGFMMFGIASAALTALGRAEPFGVDHAFVTRYVSFSSVFWLGWVGLMALSLRSCSGGNKWRRRIMMLVMVFAVANALHMIKQAASVGEKSRATANLVRDAYPNVDSDVLRDIYFEQADAARAHLDKLHQWSFAPFDEARPAHAGGELP